MRRRNQILQTWFMAAAMLVAIGCQQKCQQPPTTAFKSLTDAQWRMVETTDPDIVKTLDRFNFRIVTFTANFTGSEALVQDNQQYDNPILTFTWVPNPDAKVVRMKYTAPATGTASNGSVTAGADKGTYDYTYHLSTHLELTESKRGYYYRFVPFTGVVQPDSTCSF